MYVNIHNENYGYSVATFGDFVTIGDPAILRWNPSYPTQSYTGSVDVFLFDYALDQHKFIDTLYKFPTIPNEVILAAETSSVPVTGSYVSASIHTELTGSAYTRDKDLLIDRNLYTYLGEDGYGLSLDVYNKILAVGCPYYLQLVETSASLLPYATGSCVDMFNLVKYEADQQNKPSLAHPIHLGFGTGSKLGHFKFYAEGMPSGYDILELLFSTSSQGPYNIRLDRQPMYGNGGYYEFYVPLTIMQSYNAGFFVFRTSVDPNPYILSINNPDYSVGTGSFGMAVSLNGDWLAVGSPYVSGSEGMVYMYRNQSVGNNYSWSLQQKIVPNTPLKGLYFGSCLEMNKVTGSMSGSLIVGIGNNSGSRAFLFEYISSSWSQTFTFYPWITPYPLQFGGYMPYSDVTSSAMGYGTAVAMYNNTVVIGAPMERQVQEFSSSAIYHQGAVYVYERCTNIHPPALYALVYKTFGDETTLKNNRLGHAVSIYGDRIAAGCIKVADLEPCGVMATIDQLHYCIPDLENSLNGQVAYLLRNTSSLQWEIAKVYQRKKRYLSPYRDYGWAVDIADKSMVIGAPMTLSGSFRQINVDVTASLGINMDDITGKAYIYNLKNYRPEFHVGNVFYRNGKIFLMTSGSVFDGILFNPVSPYLYEYEMDFKSEHTIFEKQIVCSVVPGEFNVSTNPTAVVTERSIWDLNGNGEVDFQDVDVLLTYMQYKYSKMYGGGNVSLDWSSSIVTKDDEKSLLRWYQDQYQINNPVSINQIIYRYENTSSFASSSITTTTANTNALISASISRFEYTDTWMQDALDLNQDNRIDVNDMNIMWKYFANRLTQANYTTFITPACSRKLFSDIVDHMDFITKKSQPPQIKAEFFDYENLSALDRTGSFLAPMATTIGLYAGLDLVAVAKLGAPVKISPELPLNFVVKMDF